MNKDLDSSGIDDFMRNIESRGPAKSPLDMMKKDTPAEGSPKKTGGADSSSLNRLATLAYKEEPSGILKPTRPQSSNIKKTTTLSTGAKKSAAFKPIEDEGDISDRCYRIEKENLELKTKDNVL